MDPQQTSQGQPQVRLRIKFPQEISLTSVTKHHLKGQ
jgi:hypothetical protein